MVPKIPGGTCLPGMAVTFIAGYLPSGRGVVICWVDPGRISTIMLWKVSTSYTDVNASLSPGLFAKCDFA